MFFEYGSHRHLKPIAEIYCEAFPESVQLFFAGKNPARLVRLLTNAYSFLYFAGARVVIARTADGQVLGYCVYTCIKSGKERVGFLFKNIGRVLQAALKCMRDLRLIEIGRLAANSILMRMHTRADQKLPRRSSQILSIAVRPAAQGHGIGKALLAHALDDLVTKDCC